MNEQQLAGQTLTQNESVSTPVAQPTPVQQEKLLPQSDVDRVVGRAKHESYERGRQAALEELQRQQPQPVHQSYSAPVQSQPTLDVEQLVDARVDQKIQAISQAYQNQQQMNWAANETQRFTAELAKGKEAYTDFNDVIAPLEADLRDDRNGQLATLIPEINKLENGKDVLYALGKDLKEGGTKLSSLLAVRNSPAFAKAHLDALSNSIKLNKAAASQPKPNAPLSHITPSNSGVDNGQSALAQAKAKYQGRG